MTTLSSLLQELRDSESLKQGAPKTPGSPSTTDDTEGDNRSCSGTMDRADGITSAVMGITCDDCGWETPIALVTDYGARYCRRCVTFAPIKRTKVER